MGPANLPELQSLHIQSKPQTQSKAPAFQWKLWIYTNYDCNLHCSYCVAKSSPNAARRALSKRIVEQLVNEAVELGFSEIYFTGGEPFILKDIYDMLAYASKHVRTWVLTNAMVIKSQRLQRLIEINNSNLILQVSLDGGRAEHHDAYRGRGTWQQTVESIYRLQDHGFRVRLSTTETPVNSAYLEEVCSFHREVLGIPDEDHFVRPLAKRGYSKEGLELNMENLMPEVTINLDGVFWHPLSTDADLQVSKSIFPLSEAVTTIQSQLEVISAGGKPLVAFT